MRMLIWPWLLLHLCEYDRLGSEMISWWGSCHPRSLTPHMRPHTYTPPPCPAAEACPPSSPAFTLLHIIGGSVGGLLVIILMTTFVTASLIYAGYKGWHRYRFTDSVNRTSPKVIQWLTRDLWAQCMQFTCAFYVGACLWARHLLAALILHLATDACCIVSASAKCGTRLSVSGLLGLLLHTVSCIAYSVHPSIVHVP